MKFLNNRQTSVHWSSSRGYTGHQPRINRPLCSSIGLHGISFVRASEETFRTVVLDAMGRKRDGCILGDRTHRHPALPCPAPPAAPPCAAPSRPARGMSGFWVRQIMFFFYFGINAVVFVSFGYRRARCGGHRGHGSPTLWMTVRKVVRDSCLRQFGRKDGRLCGRRSNQHFSCGISGFRIRQMMYVPTSSQTCLLVYKNK